MIFKDSTMKHAENGFMRVVVKEPRDVGFCRECLYPLDHFGFYWNAEVTLCTTCYTQQLEELENQKQESYEDDREYESLF